MQVLVIGDFHIPSRASMIPEPIMNVISNKKFDLVLCTGDLVDEKVLDMLGRFGPVKWVVGNMDYINGPKSVKVKLGNFDIGVYHGTGIYPRGDPKQLYSIAKRLNVDVLIHGHTHALSIQLFGEVLLLNPGSATGVWGGGPASLKPSFMILEVRNNELVVNGYELVGAELKRVTKKYTKTSIGIKEI